MGLLRYYLSYPAIDVVQPSFDGSPEAKGMFEDSSASSIWKDAS